MGAVLGTVFLLIMLIGGLATFRTGSKRIRTVNKAVAKANADGFPTESQLSKLKAANLINGGIRWGGFLAAAIALIILATMAFTTVSAKNVGVAVNFGAVSEQTLNPGPHLKAPWTKVVEIDGTIQTDQYEGDACIPVRIGDGSQGCADIVNRWQINPEKAAGVYEQHRSDDPTMSFRSAIVSTQLKQSVQEALKDYNPIAQLKSVGSDELSVDLSFAPDYGDISKVIEDDMKERLSDKDQAQIEGITFSYLRLSDNTQRKLDDYVAAIGETRIATQQEETAKAQARANSELSASVSNDPNVLVSRCFDLLKDAAQSNYNLPAGFSCWPGGGSSVVIPGSSAPAPAQ